LEKRLTKILIAAALLLNACTVGGSSPGSRNTASNSTSTSTNTGTGTLTPGIPRTVTINWTANREKSVNSAGGGYRVYFSQTNNFSLLSGTAMNSPYVSGAAAPNTVTTPALPSGTYYYRVVAYSSANPSGAVSSQYAFVVP